MDGTAATIVVLIFVVSIIGGITNKKNEHNLAGSQGTTTEAYVPETIYSTVEGVQIPSEHFVDGYTPDINLSIKSYITRNNNKLPEWDAQNISECIVRYSRQYDVNPKLVAALMCRESGFNKFAISPTGAQGLGQLLPSTAKGLGVVDPFDIDENTKGTVRYIRSMLDRYSGPNKVPYAIASYFEGPNAVQRQNGYKLASKKYVEDILRYSQKI